MSPEKNQESLVRILVVDDDDNLRMILADRLSAQGYRVDEASTLEGGLQRLQREDYQLLLLDVYLPDQKNLEGLPRFLEMDPGLPIIVMTAHGTIDLAVEAMKRGAYDFITKPMDFKRLALVVDRVLESSQLRTELNYLRQATDRPFSDIIGENSGLRRTMDLARDVALADATVLIRGETGTGKEVIARAIHRLSGRRKRSFVVANCAAIPRELMESEMFGHARGAFTGAINDHCGYFEAAGSGTLLLDEIGDLNLDLQAKILRVLEDGSFRRVGSSKTLHNRARILACTHQPLEKLMEEGKFREDLYYRLNVFPIELPPLRHRKQDIPTLAEHFLRLGCRGHRAEILGLSEEAFELLQEHSWRGNVRELRNCMERLALTVNHPIIGPEDLHPLLDRNSTPPSAAAGTLPLRELEREAIEQALHEFDGNRTQAAQALGIGRRTLQNKLKLFGMMKEENQG